MPRRPGPGAGRAAMSSSSKAAPVPSIASRLMAPMTSAVSASRSASWWARQPMPAMSCVPLRSASPSLAPSVERRQAGARQRLAAGTGPGAVDGRLALADEHERDVRQRRQVARRAEAAARRHDRVDGRVEHADQQLDEPRRGRRRARPPARWRAGGAWPARPRPAAGRRRRRRGSARGCAGAPRSGPARCARRRGRRSRSSRRRRSLPRSTRRSITAREARIRSAASGVERDRPPAARDLDDVVDREVPAGERKGRHRSLYYAPCDGCRTP